MYLNNLFKDYFSLSVGMACQIFVLKLLDFFTAGFVTGLFLNSLSPERDFIYQCCQLLKLYSIGGR
jgi:hypothetical protein